MSPSPYEPQHFDTYIFTLNLFGFLTSFENHRHPKILVLLLNIWIFHFGCTYGHSRVPECYPWGLKL